MNNGHTMTKHLRLEDDGDRLNLLQCWGRHEQIHNSNQLCVIGDCADSDHDKRSYKC